MSRIAGNPRPAAYNHALAVRELSAADPKLGKLIERAGPFTLRVSSTQSPFQAIAESIIYQQLHGKNFRGSSQGFALALNISAFLGLLTGLAYLAYYGWRIVWWAPIVIFVIGILASMLGFLVERIVGSTTISTVAFIGWPICAYFMFSYVPG